MEGERLVVGRNKGKVLGLMGAWVLGLGFDLRCLPRIARIFTNLVHDEYGGRWNFFLTTEGTG